MVALSGAVYAADMPVKAPMVAPVPYTSWTGFYVGAHLGVAALDGSCSKGTSSDTFSLNLPCFNDPSLNNVGFLGGVQAGYDWQDRGFVYGVIADWAWTSAKASSTGPAANTSTTPSIPYASAQVEWLASFRGRFGMAVDDTLFYGTAGVALGSFKDSASYTGTCCGDWSADTTSTKAGWVAGGGVEHKLTKNLSLVGEVLYYGFGHSTLSNTNLNGYTYNTEFSHNVVTATVGANWRW
jgi:outer membrane immunogenic protein